MTVSDVPVELLVMSCARGTLVLEVDANVGNPRVRRKVVAMLRDIIAAFLEKPFQRKVNRGLAGAILAVE